ncbi:hypothetical protein V6N13_073319 [Hibiscus sabdariffa]
MAGSSTSVSVADAQKHSETCKLVPSEFDLDVSLPSPYSKSYDFELVISDKTHYKRFLYASFALAFLVLSLALVLHFLPHKNHHHRHSNNLTLAVNRALTFFDAQKSGSYPSNSPISFRGSSGLQDGNSSNIHVDLVGGFYDSGNNIKFTFPTAYTITLLSWSVIEYHPKYADIGELEHIKDIIKWGSDYLLKVGSASNDTKNPVRNDINCWQRPEDMSYKRPVSVCNETASDLAGEIVAALSAASIVFKQDNGYSQGLVQTAEMIYEATEKADRNHRAVTYTTINACGGEAREFYDSSGYKDELVWGATWLFFATGNHTYLDYATTNFAAAADNETVEDRGVFYWNNKITANAVLFARLRFFRDLGFPYEKTLELSSNMTDQLMCSYLSDKYFNTTPGDNPRKMSYMVGFGDRYPTRVHHRSASVPWDGQYHSCDEGNRWLNSQDQNPNILLGAVVAGPDHFDDFSDERDKPWFTEPSIASNAALVAALIAHHDPPRRSSASNSPTPGLDLMGIFEKVQFKS